MQNSAMLMFNSLADLLNVDFVIKLKVIQTFRYTVQ